MGFFLKHCQKFWPTTAKRLILQKNECVYRVFRPELNLKKFTSSNCATDGWRPALVSIKITRVPLLASLKSSKSYKTYRFLPRIFRLSAHSFPYSLTKIVAKNGPSSDVTPLAFLAPVSKFLFLGLFSFTSALIVGIINLVANTVDLYKKLHKDLWI